MIKDKENTGVLDLPLVKKVLAFLKIGEDGKIANFFGKEVSKFEKAIRDINRNKTTIENSYKDAVDDLNDKLADAEESVKEALLAITSEDVKTNDAANNFSSIYWSNIDRKLAEVARIKKSMETLKERFDKEIEYENSQISKYQGRIDMIKQ